MRRVLAIAAGVAAVALGLTGCVPTGGPLAMQPRAEAWHDALLTGTLHIDDDCVWVETADAAYVPVFPVGSARMEAGRLLYGATWSDGDTIDIGGGEAPEAGADWYIPDGCPDALLWGAAPPPEG
ncbi:hypothetical protein [Microbacterium sp. Root180]|uniref:hypothetical protein n=1 Tax=Microbacterium sp. Root180 TaxID=1736483 RepID=UPI0006F5ACFE|nr:hypothetical protein [Microbacterium sp. Root180]KRB37206.1 hypothetical protein ASD93_14595 [Microbacterium sp. Root180]